MKTTLFAIFGACFAFLNGLGDQVDTAAIRQLMERMDDSLIQGQIFHINYVVCDKCTDAFYLHKKEMIKFLEDNLAKESSPIPPDRQETWRIIIRQWKKELDLAKEQTCFSDYSLDGKGFYLKRSFTYVNGEGKTDVEAPTIYVSDGKIMGNFYPDQSTAVIQPSTERPQVPEQDWTEIAYLYMHKKISTYMENMSSLSLKEEADCILITGEKPAEKKAFSHAELRIDKATLTPQSLTFVYYNVFGALYGKKVKTWQFQTISGLLLPKNVIVQDYETDLSGKLNLEKETTFTINKFDVAPIDATAEFARLLKSNYSVFDEITGTHYLSGDAGSILDKLSK
jgi:hypothetical protein